MGVAGEIVARHARIPAIVPLLVLGVVLGPDVLGVIQPNALGAGLYALIEIGVAVVLFEGGLGLELGRLRRGGRPIRRLVTIGAVITAAGGTLATRLTLGWPWSQAALFGTLVIVTGPTVIAPLLRHVRVRSRVGTVLEAEGVLIDPIGAIVAAVALQIALGAHESIGAWGLGALSARLGVGFASGLGGGFALALLLRTPGVVPQGLGNLVALGGALALFAGCEALLSQTGVLAVTIAGVVLGNAHTGLDRELREFHGLLTVGLIGLLFVLLTADVRLADVWALGLPGLAAVGLLVFVVRPLEIAVCTAGSELDLRERAFLAWIAPRGIVAAGIASLFAESLAQEGLEGGTEMRALVFLVIAATVLAQGATAGAAAQVLGLRLPPRDAVVVLGANELALAFADALQRGGRSVRLLDANPAHCRAAQERGFTVVYGNALEPSTIARARLDDAAVAVGLTPNDEVNSVFAREVREAHGVPVTYVAVGRGGTALAPAVLERQASHTLFDRPKDVERWSTRLRHDAATAESWRFAGRADPAPPAAQGSTDAWVMLTVERGGNVVPMDARWDAKPGDVTEVLVHEPERERAAEALRALGWEPVRREKIG